jgi:hypothetical protein
MRTRTSRVRSLSCRRAIAGWTILFAASAALAGARALTWEHDTIATSAGPEQAEVAADFAFRNTSAQPVTVTKIETSCGCTTALPAQRTYRPGDGGHVHVVFTVADRTGLQEKFISVATNAPGEDDPVELTLRIDIHAYFGFAPKAVFWKMGEAPVEKTIACTALMPPAIGLTSAVPADPMIEARVEIVEPGRKILLHLKPRSTAKPIETPIHLTFSVDHAPTRSFDAYAYVAAPGSVGG